MPTSFTAVLVLAVALLPGALMVWSFERPVGPWGISLADRTLRFIGASAMFHALLFPISYAAFNELWPGVRDGTANTWLLWPLVVLYTAIPLAAGYSVGLATRRQARWTRFIVGGAPAPRAWDYLFRYDTDGWIRMRLKSGTWLGGVFAEVNGRRSYVAGYPEPQDIYLAAGAPIDQVTGQFIKIDGAVELEPGGILVRWDEVEYLEFIESRSTDVEVSR